MDEIQAVIAELKALIDRFTDLERLISDNEKLQDENENLKSLNSDLENKITQLKRNTDWMENLLWDIGIDPSIGNSRMSVYYQMQLSNFLNEFRSRDVIKQK